MKTSSYPAILKTLDFKLRKSLARYDYLGEGSIVTEIDKSEANKKKMNNTMLLYVDSKDRIFAYGRNTYVHNVNHRWRDALPTRKGLIADATKIYAITESQEIKEKTFKRRNHKDNDMTRLLSVTYINRYKNLIGKYEPKLINKVEKLKNQYSQMIMSSLNDLTDRIKKGDVFTSNDVFGKSYGEETKVKKQIEEQIAKIGYVFWQYKSGGSSQDTAEQVINLSKEIKKLLE